MKEPMVFRSVVLLALFSALILPVPLPGGIGVEHCVLFVIGQHDTGEFIVSEPVCYRTLQEVDSLAAAGTVAAFGTVDGASKTVLASITLGRHFDGLNGTGSSISIVGGSCTGGYWNTSASWDNRISSSFNGCARLRHFDLPNKGGSFQDTSGAGTTDNLSLLDNKAESISYHSS